jgi:hypothetical protein
MTHSLKLGGHALGLAITAILVSGIWSPAAAGPVSFKEAVFPILQLR